MFSGRLDVLECITFIRVPYRFYKMILTKPKFPFLLKHSCVLGCLEGALLFFPYIFWFPFRAKLNNLRVVNMYNLAWTLLTQAPVELLGICWVLKAKWTRKNIFNRLQWSFQWSFQTAGSRDSHPIPQFLFKWSRSTCECSPSSLDNVLILSWLKRHSEVLIWHPM